MSKQDVENKGQFLHPLLSESGVSPRLAQILFLVLGAVFTLSAFLILQSFISGLIEDERARMSQEIVQDTVADLNGVSGKIDNLSDMIALSSDVTPQALRDLLKDKSAEYSNFSQIIWFYKSEGGKWSFSDLLRVNSQSLLSDAEHIKPDAKILSALMDQNALEMNQARVLEGIADFKTVQERQVPRTLSGSFMIVKSVEIGVEEKGFVAGIVNVSPLYDEKWLAQRRNLSFMRIRDVKANRTIFELELGQSGGKDVGYKQMYEFLFAGRNWEVMSTITQDQRTRFLEIFPYMVLAFGGLLTIVGALYVRRNQRQAGVFAKINEELEQKNYELQAAMRKKSRVNVAVKAAAKKSRAVIDAVGDVIFETDDSGEVIFLNKAWESVTGFEVEQTLGQKLYLMIHPQDHEQYRHDFRDIVEGRKDVLHNYTQLRCSDGKFRAVELSMAPIRHGEGDGLSFIGTFRDIEERRRAERALSEAEKKYRNIVENAAGGIYQLTLEGLYLSANPAFARILGYDSPEQLLREVKNANESIYVDAADRQSFYGRLQLEHSQKNYETRMRCRDGEIIWVSESARLVQDQSGQTLFIEGSIEDITQRKNADAAIREAKIHSDLANRAKSEFLSNMSHELRTPLNSIIGFSEMLKSEVYGKIERQEYRDYVADIHESGMKLLRVINEILDISKIEAGERQLNESVVNIRDVVASAQDLLDIKVENSRLTITTALDDVPEIIGEEIAIKQIVINLLSNAIKFTPDEGRVTISGHLDKEGAVHLSITDTGVGLDEQEIQKALSPFGQLDNDFARSGSGTGLGLTLVDALAKLHGAEFELFSQKGIGTTATVIFPADRVVKSGKSKEPQAVSKNEGATS